MRTFLVTGRFKQLLIFRGTFRIYVNVDQLVSLGVIDNIEKTVNESSIFSRNAMVMNISEVKCEQI